MRAKKEIVRLPDLDIIVAVVVFVILSAMVAIAVSYTHEARLAPLVVGVPAVLLAGWQLWVEILTRRSRVAQPPGTSDGDNAVDETRGAHAWSREAIAIFWLLLFTTMVLIGGLVVGGTLGVMTCQRIWLRESWRTTAWSGAFALLVLHVFFERGLGLGLFHGWFVEWMR
jgi:hypothetical protein